MQCIQLLGLRKGEGLGGVGDFIFFFLGFVMLLLWGWEFGGE